MRPRCGLGMVLHCEERELAMANPLDGPVVQIEVRDLERGRSGNAVLIANHSETMVLGGDEHLIGADVAYRVVSASVTVGQLGGPAAVGEPHQLVPETDAEGGETGPGELTNRVERVADGGGVARDIERKRPSGFSIEPRYRSGDGTTVTHLPAPDTHDVRFMQSRTRRREGLRLRYGLADRRRSKVEPFHRSEASS